MASPGNQYCANCIGILSFPIENQTFLMKFNKSILQCLLKLC